MQFVESYNVEVFIIGDVDYQGKPMYVKREQYKDKTIWFITHYGFMASVPTWSKIEDDKHIEDEYQRLKRESKLERICNEI